MAIKKRIILHTLTNYEGESFYNRLCQTGGEAAGSRIYAVPGRDISSKFLMNVCVLTLTGRMMRQTCRAGRIAAGGAAGALWACGGIFLPLSFPMKAALTCGPVSLLMVFLAFRERHPVRLLKGTAALYLTAVLMAGGLELVKGLSARVYNYENPANPRQQKLPFYVLFLRQRQYSSLSASCLKRLGRNGGEEAIWQVPRFFPGEKSSGAGISRYRKPADRSRIRTACERYLGRSFGGIF